MHILYLHQHFALPSGSTGTRSYEMARRWVAAGHTVTVICGKNELSGLPLQKHIKAGGVHVRIAGARYSQKQGFFRRSWSFVCFILAASFIGLRLKNVDIIYATSTPLTIGIPALLLKLVRRVRFVFEVRDQWPEVPIELGIIQNPVFKNILLWLERRIYLSAAAIVALSPGMADGVRSVLGDSSKQVLLAPNSSDIGLFRPEKDGGGIRSKMGWDSRFVIMHFGAMGRANGLDFLVDAARHCSGQPDILFVVIGSGGEKDRLKKCSETLQLNNILFLDAVSKSDIPEWVAACDAATVIFADYPILEHNSANKFFDALAAGKPVLLNYSGWQRDILESRQAGMGCQRCDCNAYVNNVYALYNSKDSVQRMGVNARILAETTFNRDTISLSVLALLEEAYTDGRR